MGATAGIRGVYGIPFSACTVDDAAFDDAQTLAPGTSWSWGGQPMRLDGPQGLFLLEEGAEQRRLRRGAARWLGRPEPPPSQELDPILAESVELTDGVRVFRMAVLPEARLAVFAEGLPPPGEELWVLRCPPPAPASAAPPQGRPVASFLAGTRIATPDGMHAAEDLCVGDPVLTRDGGAQPLSHVGRQVLSGAELYLWPGLRPIRIGAGALGPSAPIRDVWLAPDHRVLVGGPEVASLFGEENVLVRVGDLVDHVTVRPDHGLRQAHYVHLGLPRPEILIAEGLGCESLPPDQLLQGEDHTARGAALALGAGARRCLQLGEAALLAHGLARAAGL